MNAELTSADMKAIRAGLIEKLYKQHREELDTLSPAQVAGILDVSIKTLWEIEDLPRIEVTAKVIKYLASDVAAWLKKHRKFPEPKE